MARRLSRARLAHGVLIVVGLMIFLFPLTVGTTPTISCRGVVMGPGDTCAKAQNGGVQTYEQRYRTERQAKPIIVGVGVLVMAFGAYLLLAEVRRRPSSSLSSRP